MPTSMRMGWPLSGAALSGLLASSAMGSVSYTSKTPFLNELQAGAMLETFESRAGQSYGAPLALSAGAFSTVLSTTANALIVFDLAGDDYLTTGVGGDGFSRPIVMNFTSGNVTAIGGTFFLTTAFGAVATEAPFNALTLTFSDGTSQVLTAQTSSAFFGYASDTPIASLTIAPGATHRFVSLDDLYIGRTTIPAPASTGVLAVGAVLLGRRRRTANRHAHAPA